MKKTPFFDKTYLSRVVLYVSLTAIAIGAVFYLGFHLTGDNRGGIDTMYAVSETLPVSVTGNGYIIRDEKPIEESIGTGFLSPVVRDGDKVRVGSKVADVYTTSSTTVGRKITLLEDQITFYERCLSTHATVGDTSSVHKDVTSSIINVRRRIATGEISAAADVKPSLTMSIRRLGVLTGRVTDFSSQITSLEGQLSQLRSSLGSSIGSINAPYSGYYFSTTDGFEGVFSSDAIDSVTYSDLVATMDMAKNAAPQDGSAGKIVSSFRWYVACRMTSAEASGFKKNGTYSVVLKNNIDTPLDMKVHKIMSNAADAVVVFECTSIPDGYDYTRVQEFVAISSETKAFRLPMTAIRVHDGIEGVFVLDEVTVVFRRVEVISEEDGYFMCSYYDPEEESADVETDESEKADETESESDEPYYFYLRENDLVITAGTGLYVGMTYNPTK